MNDLKNHAPVQSRILIIDIIRGFALFGILLVNTPSLNTPAFMDTNDFGFKTTALDHSISSFIFTFAMESFYPIFALLFGVGAAIFLSKQAPQISKLFWRRMAFLLFVGVLDAIFIWWGDILIVYALLGSLLVFFADLKTRTLGLIALAIMCIVLLLGFYENFGGNAAIERFWPETASIYAQGNFFEISVQRFRDYIQVYFLNASPIAGLAYYLDIFGIMLLGMWVHKKGILTRVHENKLLIAKIGVLSLGVAILYVILADVVGLNLEVLAPLKGLSTGIFYSAVIALFSCIRIGHKLLSPLAQNGRMSLSCYLFFNLSLSLIFYGYGLGFYGSLGPAGQMPIVAALYLSSLLFSTIWLKYFPYGPFEWLWRLVTYGGISNTKKRAVMPLAKL